ncbi:MAG TPA: LysR family transcriptional regulator, partial [Bradyrhizobium sp.]
MASELEVFVLVAESGGFASAARRLRLTPSAISRRVALLEDRLGLQLLSRTTRKVELTAVG